jgi:PBP1b-binding outer membrane lipoprotein LpoB
MPNMLKYKYLISLVFTLFLVNGCSVRYVAEYDAAIKDETVKIAKQVDLFWGQMLETASEDRSYDKFKDQYTVIETEIRGLLMKNKIRALNNLSTAQVETLLELWIEDREMHKKDNTFSDFLANRHRKQFVRVFIAIAKGEDAKNMSDAGAN